MERKEQLLVDILSLLKEYEINDHVLIALIEKGYTRKEIFDVLSEPGEKYSFDKITAMQNTVSIHFWFNEKFNRERETLKKEGVL